MDIKKNLIKPETISEITRDIGQVFFATMVIAPITSGGPVNKLVFIAGSFFALFAWIISVIINKQ